jgi:hypothetical protein
VRKWGRAVPAAAELCIRHADGREIGSGRERVHDGAGLRWVRGEERSKWLHELCDADMGLVLEPAYVRYALT